MPKTKTKTVEADDSLFAPVAGQESAQPEPKGKFAVTVHGRRAGKTAAAAPPARVVQNSAVEVMAMIERVALAPGANPDNLTKLLDLQERILDRQAKQAFNEAFVVMAPALPMVTKDGRIIVKEKTASGRRDGETTQDTPYAKWETISAQIVPVLSQHGFSIRHRTETAPDGKIRITAILYGHGHQEESYMDFELDSTGSKNNAQARVSATTYGRRITACTAINLVAKGEDDDGKSSGPVMVVGDPLTPEELEQVIALAAAVMCPDKHLVRHLSERRPKGHPELTKIADLPRTRFEEAVAALRSYEANRMERERQANTAAAT